MSTITVELYDVLIAAGTPEEKAKLATETISSQEKKLSRLELLTMGLYIFTAGGFGYIVSLLNTIITKIS